MAPAGTPQRGRRQAQSRAANEALKAEEVQQGDEPQGVDPVGGTPEDFARFIDGEIKRWDDVVQAAGLRKQ